LAPTTPAVIERVTHRGVKGMRESRGGGGVSEVGPPALGGTKEKVSGFVFINGNFFSLMIRAERQAYGFF